MNCPLSLYFIYTGHNSYLTGNQLSSDCSDVPIIQALKRGLTVIELDIWPNSTNDNVNVLHDVVVTLEDHLTPTLQAKADKMLTEIFGQLLYLADDECLRRLPSSESLKRRIIISNKPPKEYLEAKEIKDESHKGKDLGEEEAWGKKVLNLKSQVSETKDNVDEEDEDDQDPDNVDSKAHQEVPEYWRLTAIHAGKPKGGLKEALAVHPNKVRCLSLSEQQLEKAVVHHGADLVSYGHSKFLASHNCGYPAKI